MKTTTTTPASCVPKNWEDGTVWTGDNLHVMRGMNSGSVDLIYLDPPFNSNADYAAPIGSPAEGAAFKDTWTLTDIDEAWLRTIKEDMEPLWYLLMGVSGVHSSSMLSYLVYMVPRLVEMKRLLKPTGTIYLHCDPTASHYLKTIMDYIFGRENYVDEIIWYKGYRGTPRKRRWQQEHDVLLMYAADDRVRYWGSPVGEYSDKSMSRYNKVDEHGNKYALIKRTRSDGSTYYGKTYPKGKPAGNVIEVPTLAATAKERTGYPTQKPLALLERVIEASTNPGDVVLDPFCGCATTCIAAQKLGRNWVGIDISAKAAELIEIRADEDLGMLSGISTSRDDIPERTDLGEILKKAEAKTELYGTQKGDCTGCGHHFPFKNLTVDHIIPQSKGGSDHLSNLQLLCGHCNSTKGDRSQAHLKARLAELGVGV